MKSFLCKGWTIQYFQTLPHIEEENETTSNEKGKEEAEAQRFSNDDVAVSYEVDNMNLMQRQ